MMIYPAEYDLRVHSAGSIINLETGVNSSLEVVGGCYERLGPVGWGVKERGQGQEHRGVERGSHMGR